MKVYKGFTASPGLVLGQVSRLDRPPLVFGEGPFHPEQEKQALEDAIKVAQQELDEMAGRAAPSEQAIFLFQSMMLEDEGFMNEVAFQIKAGVGAAEAMDRVGRRYAAQLAAMKDNAYMQLRSVDILDVTQRITNILCHRLRSWLALDHPVILASDLLMPTDLFSVPAGRILGLITAEGSGQSHAAIIARSLNIPGITQVGEDFLKDCDGREVILNATEGECILDPDAAARQSAITCICEMQRQNEELNAQLELPNRTRDGEEFELLANCFGPEDVGTAMESGASGVGLLRSSYMMMPGHAMDEQEQYLFYTSCLAAARGRTVTVRTFDKLDIPRRRITGITMPGFGTTGRTYGNALNLMRTLGVDMREIGIKAACEQHFNDIGLDPSDRSTTYENAQARERTQILMDFANRTGGLVVGTGDLSELALGWATYNGDHMSMYGVNCGIPKTLVRYLVRWAADNGTEADARPYLLDIIDTPISPELLPAGDGDEIAQRTEDTVGPYELHDFFLYHFIRYGFSPAKLFFMACRAFDGRYDRATVKKWLVTFLRRFFSQQFKRSALPDGPKVGSISLSPRGDWRMPSDATAQLWIAEAEALPV